MSAGSRLARRSGCCVRLGIIQFARSGRIAVAATSLFASLKAEHVHQARYGTRGEDRAALFDYLEAFYNHQRLPFRPGASNPGRSASNDERG